MVFFPYCKINIGLDIIRRRTDGFHDIETVMFPVRGLCDILEIVPAERDGVEFSYGGLSVDCRTEDNLCYKAYKAVEERYDIPGVKIHLHKIIPFGAGLGGGSSDAVCTVKGLSKIFSLDIPLDEIREIAAQLGSDTVFFADEVPAISSGRGDIIAPLQITTLSGCGLLIVKPPFGVSTAAAYASASPAVPATPLAERIKLPPNEWKDTIKNDFESPVFALHPQLAGIKSALYDSGAMYASMSGSGSAVYGIYANGALPVSIKEKFPDCFVYHEVIA